MPDEVNTPVGDSANGEASPLEQLIAEAEAQSQTPLQDHPKPCIHSNSATLKPCPTCGWPFCENCASPLDPQYCKLCLGEADAEIKESPLTDVDGVTHNGRELHPTGPRFNSTLKTISEMSDPELEAYIRQYHDLVKQAERALDFRRVVLGAANIESAQRADAKRRALRADTTKYAVKTVSIDPKTGKQVTRKASMSSMADMLKALNEKVAQRQALAALEKLKGVQHK